LTSQVQTWSGDDWEAHVQKLLKTKFGISDYQEVPSNHKGDFGIDGFTLSGHAFQCYAAEGYPSVADLYDKQRSKITDDLNKLVENQREIQKMLGNRKLHWWHLVVPRHESAVLRQHATAKSADIRKAGLAFIADDFEVCIIDGGFFEIERHRLEDAGALSVSVDESTPNTEDVASWEMDNPELLETLRSKLAKLPDFSDERRAGLCDSLLKGYVAGQRTLDTLRRDHPFLHRTILQYKIGRANSLRIESAARSVHSPEVLTAEMERFSNQVKVLLPNLSIATVNTLCCEAVVSWLFQCPLDFP
jgi:hypothetical protein